jgi:RNA polymerase sigma factor (sigma-70 family)
MGQPKRLQGIKAAPVRAPDDSFERLDWRVLYERYAEELGHYVTKLTNDVDLARDVVQDAFARAIEREEQLRDRALVRAWLYRIATNLAVSELRRRRLRARFRLDRSDSTARADPASRVPETDQVRRALANVPPAQVACLVLRERGFNRSEIAQICGVGEEAVKSRLARGEANFSAAYHRLERNLLR